MIGEENKVEGTARTEERAVGRIRGRRCVLET